MESIIEQSQLLWQCRRGMLELDLLLIPFAEKKYIYLPDKEKKDFRDLLHYPDPVLFAWIMGHESPEEPELVHIVQLIRRFHNPSFF